MDRNDPPADATESGASRLFDLRLVIGGLFVVYGVTLIVVGFTSGAAAIQRAAGVNINLWTGIGMLILGVVFLVWQATHPLHPAGRKPGD